MAERESFSLREPRYDSSSFIGRYRNFINMVDPRLLLVRDDELIRAKSLLEEFKTHGHQVPAGRTTEELWAARKIVNGIIHPDTGEKVFMPVGMLLPNPTVASTVFWQWLNQSHNAGVNYANRNATSPVSDKDLFRGYAAAVTSSVTIALGLNRLAARYAPRLAPFVAFPAVASANVLNVRLMRAAELQKGIDVTTSDGKTVGVSVEAARRAINETAITRVALPVPLLVLPPLVFRMLEKFSFWSRNPRLQLPIKAAVCSGAFLAALPGAIALFPQIGRMPVNELEEPLRSLVRERHPGLSEVEYNKGL